MPPGFSAAWRALKAGRVGMDLPIALAIVLAIAISIYETLQSGRHAYFDAAVMLLPPDNRLSQSGTKLTASALEQSGVPVLIIDADMVDAKIWDHDRMVGMVARFLEERGLT